VRAASRERPPSLHAYPVHPVRSCGLLPMLAPCRSKEYCGAPLRCIRIHEVEHAGVGAVKDCRQRLAAPPTLAGREPAQPCLTGRNRLLTEDPPRPSPADLAELPDEDKALRAVLAAPVKAGESQPPRRQPARAGNEARRLGTDEQLQTRRPWSRCPRCALRRQLRSAPATGHQAHGTGAAPGPAPPWGATAEHRDVRNPEHRGGGAEREPLPTVVPGTAGERPTAQQRHVPGHPEGDLGGEPPSRCGARSSSAPGSLPGPRAGRCGGGDRRRRGVDHAHRSPSALRSAPP